MSESAEAPAVDPGTPTWLRARNDRMAFRLLLEHGPLTRARLGALSGLSKPTAAQMISRLEQVALIEPVGEVSAGRGPNAVSYGVRADRIVGVAIAMLGREARARVVDAIDRDHPVAVVSHEASGRSPEGDVRRAVRAACDAAGIDAATVAVVVLGVQAAVDETADELSLTDTLPGWPAIGSRARLAERLGLDAVIENDVNLATRAERSAGVAGDASSFALLWLGDGLGVGIDLGGVVHRGATGGAGEIGYLEVPRSAARLDPDAEDFTDLLGGPAVARLAGRPGGLGEVLPALAGDEALLGALADRVVLALAPLTTFIDPALVVLGGPTGEAAGPRLAELVAERLAEAADGSAPGGGRRAAGELDGVGVTSGPAVRASALGPDGVLAGARQLLVERLRDRLEAEITLD